MNWCFAIVNGRLAEIFFERKGKSIEFLGNCHVKKEEYKTKRELNWIKKDTEKVQFSYKNKIAKRADTTPAVLSRLENQTINPSIGLLQRIAQALGKNLEVKFT